jgi:NTE family protein
MTRTKPIYGLVCAGGGAHGAYQVGVLKYVHEHFCNGDASPFRIFCGTSAGSLNTCFFASRSFDARVAHVELEKLWIGFHVPHYHGNIVVSAVKSLFRELTKRRSRRKPCWSLLDPRPLVDIVGQGFVRESFERSMAEDTTLCLAVAVTELRSSRLVFFVEGPNAVSWNSGLAIAIKDRLEVAHVAASCSVPFVFPPIKIGEHYYSDGGVANKTPFGPAINMGATRILSVATDRPLPDELPQYPPGFKPRLRETIRMLGDQLSYDYATTQARWIELINYFREQLPARQFEESVGPLMSDDQINLANYSPVEIKLFAPSRRIRHTDIFSPEFFDQDLEDTSTVLRFHEDFVRKLIGFGYEDAAARHDELVEFFDPDRPQRPSFFSGPRTMREA